jgi:hypothetical protein
MGSYAFDWGSECCHEDRIFWCWSDTECTATEPGTEGTSEIWELTTYTPAPHTAADILNMIIPVKECSYYEGEGFPYMQGDIVCDPMYPEFVAWACIDSSACSSVEIDLDNYDRIIGVWDMVTAEEADFVVVDAPVSEGVVECEIFADKFGKVDIGEGKNFWCDAGRVYECVEMAVTIGAVNPDT